jgi:hypothetical protein
LPRQLFANTALACPHGTYQKNIIRPAHTGRIITNTRGFGWTGWP